MIKHNIGSLLDVKSGFIVHGCNAQGRMGAGIAAFIRKQWPEVYNEYYAAYKKGYRFILPTHKIGSNMGEIEMGTIIPVPVSEELIVINAITQQFYTGHKLSKGVREVDYEAVARCFEQINLLPEVCPEIEPVLHFPLLGAGLALGNWKIIETIIDETVTNMEKNLWVLGND